MKSQRRPHLPTGYLVVDRDDLTDPELEGIHYGGAGVCLIFVDLPTGEGPRLHRHTYEEIFIVLEGNPRFTVGSETVEARAGQILFVRPLVPHKFVNGGTNRLRQIDIHVSPAFSTEWLE